MAVGVAQPGAQLGIDAVVVDAHGVVMVRRWLDPVDGAGLRISLRGAAVAVIVYAASLTAFATVEWLQYWK